MWTEHLKHIISLCSAGLAYIPFFSHRGAVSISHMAHNVSHTRSSPPPAAAAPPFSSSPPSLSTPVSYSLV